MIRLSPKISLYLSLEGFSGYCITFIKDTYTLGSTLFNHHSLGDIMQTRYFLKLIKINYFNLLIHSYAD